MNGLEHIANAFARAKTTGSAALMPYLTLGYPDQPTSLAVVESIAKSGADLIELGVPFSDPLADGPTIQHSTQIALENGITVKDCLEMVSVLHGRGVAQPLMLMGYYNPILAFGIKLFAAKAAQSGADGLIVPDLPLEEAEPLQEACKKNGLALVYLVAPTTSDKRLAQIAAQSTGFVYIVSVVGVTGARTSLAGDLQSFVQRVRAVTDKPLAIGFGISSPAQAAQAGKLADGVIVGSALIDLVGKATDPIQAAGAFIADFRSALG